MLTVAPPARHLLRAKDLIDARYREPLDVAALAQAAHMSPAHFSREFRRAFGETPHQYLLTRRLERAAALLRSTDRSVAEICFVVGLRSVGSFTSSFGRAYGMLPDRVPRGVSAGRRPRADPDVHARALRAPAVEHVSRRQLAARDSVASDRKQRDGGPRCCNSRTSTSGCTTRTRRSPSTPRSSASSSDDVTVPEMGNFRWLTVGPVGQPDVAVVLMAVPGPPVFDAGDAATAQRADGEGRRRRRSSSRPTTCQASYEELKAQGVEFTDEPMERPYGVDAGFRDPSGNQIRMIQSAA